MDEDEDEDNDGKYPDTRAWSHWMPRGSRQLPACLP